MSDLTFQIHTVGGKVAVPTFEKAVHNAISLVTQFDAGVTQYPRGSLKWYLTHLSSNGSMKFEFSSRLKRSRVRAKLPPNLVPQITENLLTGVSQLEQGKGAPLFLSEKGLEQVGEFASLLDRDEAVKFTFATRERSADITRNTAENVSKLLPIKRTAFGSVEGKLDAINIHRSHRALLYSVSRRVITCLFDPLQLEEVKAALGKRVLVRGKLLKNVDGQTVRIVNPQLKIIEGSKRFLLPNLSGKKYSLPFENAISTEAYMREVRGG